MDNLPVGWVRVTLGDVCDKPTQRKPNDDEFFYYVDISSIDRKTKKITVENYTQGIDAPSRARKVINQGDILVSMTRPNLNAVAKVCSRYDKQIASTGFDVLKPILIEPRFVFALVKSRSFIQAVSGITQGALYPACKAEDIRAFKFSLPPLPEQTRIANKLDQLLAQVDSIQSRLDKLPEIIKRFRQSVLAAAVSGRLTEGWRGCEKFGEEVALGQVTTSIKYGTSKKCDLESGQTPVIRIPNIANGYLRLDELKYADFDDVEKNKYALELGDILVIRSNGSVELVGKAAVVREKDTHLLYAGYLIRIRLNSKLAYSKYILYCLQSPLVRNVIELQARSTSGVNNINSKELAALKIPLPPLEEQTEIVRLVDQYFALADTIEKNLANAKARVDNLTQAILAKAFKGELVKPDPNDEPAEKLLARIKAARAEAEKLEKAAKKVAPKTKKAKVKVKDEQQQQSIGA